MKLKISDSVLSHIQKYSPILVIPLLCVVFLYGAIVPKDFSIYKRVGFFVVRPYRYGLYLTQQNTNIFYNVSPYQAYFIDGQGEKENLIKWENPIYSKESQLIFNPSRRYQTIMYSILSYLGLQEPSATFVFNQNKLVLRSSVENNKIAFVVDQNTFTSSNSRTLVITLSYNPEDIIFDETGIVYTQNTPDYLISDLNNSLAMNMKKAEDPNGYKTGKKLSIFNTDLNQVISFDVHSVNQEVLNINQEEYLIEFKVLNRGTDKPYIKVEI